MTLEGLRDALGAHMGSVLTPEMAAAIICAAVDREDRCIDPARFASCNYAGLIFAAESFRDIIAELEPLHAAHFAETELHLEGMAMAPDYGYMAERERMGCLLQFTARDAAGALVGNLRMYVNRSLHTGHLMAEEDTFYLAPAARRGRNAIEFVRYVERALAQLDEVVEVSANTKTSNKMARLFPYMGYRHVANQFTKILRR